ncbi:SusD/RagB family nutrient-binding outer membrane lipoprotein [Zhouia spongiae]|uniref:SusD/RagB family nutrient-binding outer membrane lipoprotein n=1 Tax=Zhouia spongiae TaxID=2202721 RepID=A0ABY3YJ34_9FLAO|nr:SusD/RagB family nutrient-binding outer membrane lipoprotein [Zhouia spongiae]UNY97861.1 SusD/RagB family nutrient-binding outer membrane lipoprotein [Zhouia spongiae]
MKKNIIIVILSCSAIFSACTGDFEEINTHPNQLEDITAGNPLNPTIYALARRNTYQARNITFGLMQVFFRIDDLVDQPYLYDLTPDIGASFWNDYYKWLTNINEIEKAAIEDEKPNYQAIALTLKAYAFSMLTDTFGDIPMEEALNAENGVFFPEFSKQEDIYQIILDYLEKANELYDSDKGMVYTDDILFGNDVHKWQKFTNSLHLRLLLRISDKQNGAYAKMTTMINTPSQYPVFTSNAEDAVLQVTGEAPNISPWDRSSDFGLFRYYGAFFIDNLNKFNDPRRPVFATVARGLNDEDYGYIGQPIDIVQNPLPDSIATASSVQKSLVEEPMIIPMLTYAEVEFIKAELAQKGYIADAKEHYENGTRAAIEMWGVEVPDHYFENEFTKYDGTLERIMLQKYYALYLTDYQSWFEHRRTGLPVLPTASTMYNDALMPSRLTYPISSSTMNSENYKDAVDAMGGDNINVKVWWDID